MFDGPDFPQSLQEDEFELWLENGRQNPINYNYLLIIWDGYESTYKPVYVAQRVEFEEYERYGSAKGREALIAVYDLYSESRIS